MFRHTAIYDETKSGEADTNSRAQVDERFDRVISSSHDNVTSMRFGKDDGGQRMTKVTLHGEIV